MVRGLIGKKIGMMSLFTPDGRYVPVTVIQAGPCIVTQVKTVQTDGYNALQLGFGEIKPTHINKPLEGHQKKAGEERFAVLKEMPVEKPEDFNLGQALTLDLFQVGDRVEITGTSKGRGFSGVIKRHGYHGGPKTHGSKSQRIPGSVGCSASPSRVFKGKKLPGRYGNDQKTVRNLEIVDIRPDANLILLKGPVPGSRSGLIAIKKPKFQK
jgi:large subunit ribosomal protein L3